MKIFSHFTKWIKVQAFLELSHWVTAGNDLKFHLLHETIGKIIKDTGKPSIMGSLPHNFGYESLHLLCEVSSSSAFLVRITNKQKQVSPSFFVDSAPQARLFDLPWALWCSLSWDTSKWSRIAAEGKRLFHNYSLCFCSCVLLWWLFFLTWHGWLKFSLWPRRDLHFLFQRTSA